MIRRYLRTCVAPFVATTILLSIQVTTICYALQTQDIGNLKNNSMMATQVIDDRKFVGVRLPSNVKPIHYAIHLKPDLKQHVFSGKVAIQYKSEEVPRCIILNAIELKITDGFIEVGTGEQRNNLTTVTYSNTSETVTLEFKQSIEKTGTLVLFFNGILNDKLRGFYRTSFKIDDQPVTAATTHFEPTGARRCFPSWDEPAIRATFTLKVTYTKWVEVSGNRYENVALSNMPQSKVSRAESTDDTEIAEVEFEKTPIMSTYLIALIVGPFESVEGTDGRRPVRVYTTPGKKEQGRFSLDVACKALRFYEDYFDIKYSLPKMDLIAIPDFLIGAMENWGLVTYRETALLVDPDNTASESKQWIALVVAHELSHQWFGNLVTIDWWTHLWLKEGFASFMEYLCIDHIFPEYDIWSQFLTDNYGGASKLDSMHNSHPIEVPVRHPNEIDEIFDMISYNKGATIIRMLYNYIGDDKFRKGMKDYLSKFAYKAAVTEDLWDSLELASDKPIRRLMSSWTSQLGYPWLSVSDYVKTDSSVKFNLTQRKFSADGELRYDELSLMWMIPISVKTSAEPTKVKEVCLMEGKKVATTIENANEGWIKLNPGTIGLYRTVYPAELFDQLKLAIKNQTLPYADRFGIQDDYFAFCQAGLVSTADFLELLRAFKDETVYIVWESIDNCLSRLDSLLAHMKPGSDCRDRFHAFGRDLFAKILERLSWDAKPDESHSDALARALVIERLIAFGDQKVLTEARRKFRAHLNATEIIPADLREACYKAVAIQGDQTDYDNLLRIYRSTDLTEEKNRVSRALSYVRGPARLQEVIHFAFSPEVRNQDRIFVLIPLSKNNPELGWNLFRQNADIFRQMYENGPLLRRLIKPVIENFTSFEKAAEIAEYFDNNNFSGAERTIKQAIETVRTNAKWLQRDSEAIERFLSKF